MKIMKWTLVTMSSKENRKWLELGFSRELLKPVKQVIFDSTATNDIVHQIPGKTLEVRGSCRANDAKVRQEPHKIRSWIRKNSERTAFLRIQLR